MAEIESSDNDLVIFDGRQSETAAAIQRGTGRMLRQAGFAWIPELPLVTGRRVDIIAVNKTGLISVVEIKSSVADFRADNKWHEYRDFCDRLYFAVTPDLPQEILPADAGLIVADAYGAEVLKEAPEHKVSAARRKAVLLRFARAAALRLHDVHDPRL
ncbi:MAG: MmcB family DNA repair protein [Rhizobiales bacterium]|nr:MmcB family DNA repair protein [Hyphomicrobiales bacterium]